MNQSQAHMEARTWLVFQRKLLEMKSLSCLNTKWKLNVAEPYAIQQTRPQQSPPVQHMSIFRDIDRTERHMICLQFNLQ